MSPPHESGSCSSVRRRGVLSTVATLAFGATVGSVGARTTDPVEIQDWHDLDAIRTDLTGEYVLTTDLDEETAGYDEHVGDIDTGWDPIGKFGDTGHLPFMGSFDGGGHEIRNLRIERPEENGVGLFKFLWDGTISAVTLDDFSVQGADIVGGLVARNDGELDTVAASGTVEAEGLAGLLGSANRGSISNATTAGTVEASKFAGGLVGANSGSIERTFSTATVRDSNTAGGLVGGNETDAEIVSSAATGSLVDNETGGGLVYRNEGAIRRSFAATTIEGSDTAGGFVVVNGADKGPDPVIESSYWDRDIASDVSGVDLVEDDDLLVDLEGYSTAQVQGADARETMAALDFGETWAAQSDPDEYPTLQWLVDDADGNDGNEDGQTDNTDSANEGQADSSDETDDNQPDNPDATDDRIPGFGVGATAVAFGGVMYLLDRFASEG